jgi:ferredoxin-NADP reductase
MTARITRSILLSEKTKHIEFEILDKPVFNFIAGQFVSVREPKGDGKFITRAYSIASEPRTDSTFDLCLNRVENGFMSNYLCDREVGDEVHVHGPHGHFVLHDEMKDTLFISTGTGIAPFRSMGRWLLHHPERYIGHNFWVIYGTRYEEDIYYREEFEQLEREHPNFHYVCTLSRSRDTWTGYRGYVQDHMREILKAHPGREMQTYICGLNEMVSGVRKVLTEEFGWDKKQINFERYD